MKTLKIKKDEILMLQSACGCLHNQLQELRNVTMDPVLATDLDAAKERLWKVYDKLTAHKNH